MKTLFLPVLLLAATSSSSGALVPATDGRLTDYLNWFGPEFQVASDSDYAGMPDPRTNTPSSTEMDNTNREWRGWQRNWSPGLGGPIVGVPGFGRTTVEVVFLGESAGWWDDWGYRINGVEYLLADGVQAVGGATCLFGDYAYFTLGAGDTLDFFVTGSGIKRQDGATTIGAEGGKYYVFDTALNLPAAATNQSYYGTLTPLTSVRGPSFLGDVGASVPFTVMAFEDTSAPAGEVDKDFNDFVFAFRASQLVPCCVPVPEASAYGLLAAAVLLGLAARRRWRPKCDALGGASG